ncbi:hypothetical protein COE15_06815 [Bacillus cereus]|nr:hypothetical protein CN288_05390 [Bacillus sp. AFS023182]PGY02990.1 hypothetical protein COE15_06815 [Bacillus cereus]
MVNIYVWLIIFFDNGIFSASNLLYSVGQWTGSVMGSKVSFARDCLKIISPEDEKNVNLIFMSGGIVNFSDLFSMLISS